MKRSKGGSPEPRATPELKKQRLLSSGHPQAPTLYKRVPAPHLGHPQEPILHKLLAPHLGHPQEPILHKLLAPHLGHPQPPILHKQVSVTNVGDPQGPIASDVREHTESGVSDRVALSMSASGLQISAANNFFANAPMPEHSYQNVRLCNLNHLANAVYNDVLFFINYLNFRKNALKGSETELDRKLISNFYLEYAKIYAEWSTLLLGKIVTAKTILKDILVANITRYPSFFEVVEATQKSLALEAEDLKKSAENELLRPLEAVDSKKILCDLYDELSLKLQARFEYIAFGIFPINALISSVSAQPPSPIRF